MKRTLALALVASLVAAPALAYGPDKTERPEEMKPSLLAAAADAAHDVVEADLAFEVMMPAQGERNTSKVVVGIALIAGGIAIIANGANLYESEEDPFGRTKNADAYLSYGIGAVFSIFGVLLLRGGLKGSPW